MRVRHGRYLIQLDRKPEESTKSGIILATSRGQDPEEAKVGVIVSGPDPVDETDPKTGDRILIRNHSGWELEGDRIIVGQEDILGVLVDA